MSEDKHRAILPKYSATPASVSKEDVASRYPDRPQKNASTACAECRRARARCTEHTPCHRCVVKDIPCLRSESDNRKGRKRVREELEIKAEALDTLITSMRWSNQESLQELLDLARAGSPTEKIVQVAKDILRRRELRQRLSTRSIQAVMSLASLTDKPPIRVPASPWTTVVHDDNAVSHLLSVYFAWHHCAYPSVDQAILVREMNSKNLSSPFCSPFLINCLLLVACNYTDHPAAFADPNDRSTRAVHFMEETMRLWEVEEAKATLPNLQAFPSLISCCVFLGKDRVGALYATQSIALANDLRMQMKKGIKQGKEEFQSPELLRSYTLALSAAFSIQTEVALAWMKPLTLQQLISTSPYQVEELATEASWQPYPKLELEVAYHPFAINEARFRLYPIAADLLPLILCGSPEDSPFPGHVNLDTAAKLSLLSEIEGRLDTWYRDLHPGAKIEIHESSPPAGPLINLQYCLLPPPLAYCIDADLDSLTYHGFHITTQNLVLRAGATADPIQEVARDKIVLACQSIANLFQWLQRTIGLDYFGVTYGHAAMLSASSLIELLPRPGLTDTFHILIVVLSHVAHRWMLVHGILRMLWITLQERKLETCLDAATLSLFQLGAVENWGPEDHRLFEMCAYPNYAAINERGRDFVQMGELLQEYARLDLGEDKGGISLGEDKSGSSSGS